MKKSILILVISLINVSLFAQDVKIQGPKKQKTITKPKNNVKESTQKEAEDAFAEMLKREQQEKEQRLLDNIVDLGLSVKWSKRNIDAVRPENYGCYATYAEKSYKLEEGFRLPTTSEYKELINNCTWELVRINGVSCYKVTGKTGNFIIIPLGGYKNSEGKICGENEFARFYLSDEWGMTLIRPNKLDENGYIENCGYNIRLVFNDYSYYLKQSKNSK